MKSRNEKFVSNCSVWKINFNVFCFTCWTFERYAIHRLRSYQVCALWQMHRTMWSAEHFCKCPDYLSQMKRIHQQHPIHRTESKTDRVIWTLSLWPVLVLESIRVSSLLAEPFRSLDRIRWSAIARMEGTQLCESLKIKILIFSISETISINSFCV